MIMIYSIRYARSAIADLDDIYEYISSNFKSPETAKAQITRIKNRVKSLAQFPKSYPVNMEFSHGDIEFRVLPVNNYNVIYRVFDNHLIVKILRVVYSRRDFNFVSINPD